MSNVEIGIWSIVAILVLIQSGMHVAIALSLVSLIGVYLVRDQFEIAGALLSNAALESVARYSFGVIPLFVLMGVLVGVSGLGRDVFEVAGQIFRRFRGGLGIATVFANAIFAAVNGTTIASASVFTKVAVPELIRQGYSRQFSVGVVAGSSVLGMLIPPSLLLILFGIIAEVSIGDLFSAGIGPGIILAVLFCLLIVGLARFAPGFTGTPQESDIPLMRASVMLQKAAPIVLLILLVLGGIYGGFFTPTEAGAVGALGALLIAVAKRRLGVRAFGGILMETGQVTASITFLLIAAHMYSRLLALSGLPGAMVDLLAVYDFSTLSILLLYLLAIILLGTILDAASILLVLVPLVLPIAIAMHLDMVWFGILTVVAVEVGLLTPPLGMACFVIRSNLDDSSITLGDIFAGALPFALVMLLLIGLLIVLPGIAIFLL